MEGERNWIEGKVQGKERSDKVRKENRRARRKIEKEGKRNWMEGTERGKVREGRRTEGRGGRLNKKERGTEWRER